MTDRTPYLAGAALLALAPVVLFTLDRGATFVWLSAVSVVVIAASVWLMLAGEDAGADPAA